MQALDNFISPVPGFDDDISISAVPISARPPGDEPASDPSSASKTRAGKQKATANPTPHKKATEAMGRSLSGIRINEPAPKAPALTPPSGPRLKILIHYSKRYIRYEYVSSFTILNL
jgi:hypothetical protein